MNPIYKTFKIKSLFIFTFLCCISFSYGQKKPNNIIKADIIAPIIGYGFFAERKFADRVGLQIGIQEKKYAVPLQYITNEVKFYSAELRFYPPKIKEWLGVDIIGIYYRYKEGTRSFSYSGRSTVLPWDYEYTAREFGIITGIQTVFFKHLVVETWGGGGIQRPEYFSKEPSETDVSNLTIRFGVNIGLGI